MHFSSLVFIIHSNSLNFSFLLFLISSLSYFFFLILSSRSRSDDSSGSSESGLQTRILSTFLNEMDGIGSKDFSEEGVIKVTLIDEIKLLIKCSMRIHLYLSVLLIFDLMQNT
jgi:hypothetical protein